MTEYLDQSTQDLQIKRNLISVKVRDKCRAVAAYLKVVRRRKSSSADGTSGGEHERVTLPLVRRVRGLPQENFEFLALLCAFLMGFYAFGTRLQTRFFDRKDISWRVIKPNAKQNRFQIVTIAPILGCHGRIQRGGGTGGPDPPEKSQKIRVSKQYRSRSPEKSQSYQASIQCWAIIGPPASDITYWIRAWLYFKELDFRKDIQKASLQLVHPLL